MDIIDLELSGLKLVNFDSFVDNRGAFTRIFCHDVLSEVLELRKVVQINHSMTVDKGAIRGMHYQVPPFWEMKFVQCIRGSVFDVVIDLRGNSSTFLEWHGEELKASDKKMIIIPEGFAHGFQTLETNSEMLYYHTEFYNPSCEDGIAYDDPRVNIKWPIEVKVVSSRDKSFNKLKPEFSGVFL